MNATIPKQSQLQPPLTREYRKSCCICQFQEVRCCVGQQKAAVENVTRTSLLELQMGNDGAVVKKEKKKNPHELIVLCPFKGIGRHEGVGWDQAIDLVSEEHYIWLHRSGHYPPAL